MRRTGPRRRDVRRRSGRLHFPLFVHLASASARFVRELKCRHEYSMPKEVLQLQTRTTPVTRQVR
jgi:hypothetical protein